MSCFIISILNLFITNCLYLIQGRGERELYLRYGGKELQASEDFHNSYHLFIRACYNIIMHLIDPDNPDYIEKDCDRTFNVLTGIDGNRMKVREDEHIHKEFFDSEDSFEDY